MLGGGLGATTAACSPRAGEPGERVGGLRAGWLLPPGTVFHLPDDVLRDASRRLEIACLVLAGLYLGTAAIVGGFWTIGSSLTDLGRDFCLRCAMVVASAVLYVLMRYRRLPPRVVIHLGLAYEVLVAQVYSGLTVSTSQGLGFVHVLVLFFPVLVPATPRVTFAVALVAGLKPQVAYQLLSGSFSEAALTSVALTLFVAAMAATHAAVICRLGDEVSEARRLGSYILEERLGSGGMGEVWRARHHLLARPAALKLIHPDMLG